MRGFEVCPQNSNQITFDLPFGSNTVESWQNRVLRQFLVVFGQMEGQMSFDLNFEAGFGILII